jgi:trigger factor
MKIEQLLDEKLHKKYLISYLNNEIEECVEQEANLMQPEMKMNGFRPGKVPVSHIIHIYGKKIMVDVLNKKVTTDIQDLIKDNNFTLAVNPIYKFRERTEIGEQDFKVDLDFYLFPELPEHKFNELELIKYKIIDSDFKTLVDENIKVFQVMTSSFNENKEKAIDKNDKVVFALETKIDGEVAPGLSRDIQVIVGQLQVPEEIENQLLGMKHGEEKLFNVSYKEDGAKPYSTLLENKDVEYTIVIKYIEEPQLNALDDNYARKFGFTGIDNMREVIAKNTHVSLEHIAFVNMREQLLKYMQTNYEFNIPDVIVDQEAHIIAYGEMSEATGVNIMEEIGAANFGIKVEDKHTEKAFKQLTTSFVLLDYARKNNIQVTESEVKQEMENRINELGALNKRLPERKEENFRKFSAQVKAAVFETKVIKNIIDSAKINEQTLEKDKFFETVKES